MAHEFVGKDNRSLRTDLGNTLVQRQETSQAKANSVDEIEYA